MAFLLYRTCCAKPLPYWMLIFILFGCVSLFSVGWLFKRIIKKLNPQQQWLEQMLSSIDNEPEQV